MRIVEGISIGISAIRSNKLRSSLTMLGIIIGIAAVNDSHRRWRENPCA